MPISISTGVHVHTRSGGVFLVGLKLSLLCMSARRFQDGEAHGVYNLCILSCELYHYDGLDVTLSP